MANSDGRGGSAYPKSIQAGIPRLEVPNGWTAPRIGKLFKVVKRPVDLVDDEEYQLVTARRNRGGIVARERLRGKDILTKSQFRVAEGDFLISRRQIAHGACGIVPAELDGAVVSNEYAVLRPTELLDEQYLRYLPHSVYFQQTCFHSSIGVHVEKLVFNLENWMRWKMPIPHPDRQKEIATILNAWDVAILNVEQTIALRNRVLAARRSQLIDGDMQPITKTSRILFSGVDKKIAVDEISIRLCNYTHIWRHNQLSEEIIFDQGSAQRREVDRFALKKGDFIFTKDSETAAEIAEVAYVSKTMPDVVCGYHLALARPRKGYNGAYLAQALRVPRIRNEFARRTNGAIRFGLTLDALSEIRVPVPSESRQNDIANYLESLETGAELLSKELLALQKQRRALIGQLVSGSEKQTARTYNSSDGPAAACAGVSA